jgi:hypothetical protein
VLSRGKQLEIHWNHEATSIRNAAKGVMRISDGGVQEVIEFNASQLRDGAVAYSTTTNDVNVRLEVSASMELAHRSRCAPSQSPNYRSAGGCWCTPAFERIVYGWWVIPLRTQSFSRYLTRLRAEAPEDSACCFPQSGVRRPGPPV